MLPHSQIRFAKLTELSEPTFMPPNVYRSNVLPHSQVWFAQRTELSEPTFMPPQRVSFQRAAALSSLVREANQTFRANVYASPTYIVPTCCRTLKFGSRSEPNFQSQRLCRPNVYLFTVHCEPSTWVICVGGLPIANLFRSCEARSWDICRSQTCPVPREPHTWNICAGKPPPCKPLIFQCPGGSMAFKGNKTD